MSRSSTPWDDPDPDRRRTGLPMDAESTSPSPSTSTSSPQSADVMASIDSSASRPEFVIADVSREHAWLSIDESTATVLEEWC